MVLNAVASSADSRSPPPVARASGSPAPRRRAASVTSRTGRVRRSATIAEATAMPITLRRPARISVALNSGRNPRSLTRAGRSASSVASVVPLASWMGEV